MPKLNIEIHKIIVVCYKELFTLYMNELGNLEEFDKFPKTLNLVRPKLKK
jgi:hypothetical protein